MAIGDQNDVLARLDAVLPPWFGSELDPILTGLLAAFAWSGSFLYDEYSYCVLQTRISTATDTNLDLIADDFFGIYKFQRQPSETDASYRHRILNFILYERATRQGMINILTLVTGFAPIIFQPNRPADTGGYSVAGCGYAVAGGWSNPNVPYQCFIIVYSPVDSAIASVAGYGIPTGAWNTASRAAWTNINNITNALNSAQIYQVINATKQEGTVCWVQIQNPPS